MINILNIFSKPDYKRGLIDATLYNNNVSDYHKELVYKISVRLGEQEVVAWDIHNNPLTCIPWTSTLNRGTPVISYNGVHTSVRHVLYLLQFDIEPPSHVYLKSICDHAQCVNLNHVNLVSK